METEKKFDKLKKFIEKNDLEIEFGISDEESPQPRSWKDIDSMIFPKNQWLVQNLFPKEGVSIFASISGEGKSLLMMYLAKCISEGVPWFGFATEQARVLYINLEMSVSEMQRRGRKINFDPKNEDLIILNEDNFNLNEEFDYEDVKYKWLLSFIYKKEVKVVIIDTFRAVVGGSKEDKAEEVRKFFQKFLILKNSGICLIFLEHLRKPGQMEGKVPKKEQLLGSQDKTANAETLLMIRRNEVAKVINVYQRKNRLGVEIPPFSVKMIDLLDSNGEEKLEFSYVGEIDDEVNAKEEAKKLVLDILSSGESKTVSQLSELVKKQVGTKNLRSAIKDLESLGTIDHFKEGKKHVFFIPKENLEEPKGVKGPENSIVSHKDENFLDDP